MLNELDESKNWRIPSAFERLLAFFLATFALWAVVSICGAEHNLENFLSCLVVMLMIHVIRILWGRINHQEVRDYLKKNRVS